MLCPVLLGCGAVGPCHAFEFSTIMSPACTSCMSRALCNAACMMGRHCWCRGQNQGHLAGTKEPSMSLWICWLWATSARACGRSCAPPLVRPLAACGSCTIRLLCFGLGPSSCLAQ